MNFITFTKLLRALVLTALVVIESVCLSGCGGGGGGGGLVGQWECLSDKTGDWGTGESMELFKDGTGLLGKEASVTWKIENKRLVLMLSGMGSGRVCNYTMAGDELILTDDEGKRTIFVKKEHVEEYKKKKLEKARKESEQAKKDAEKRFEHLSSYFTDARDGQKYRAVKIDGKTWMAENLNYQTGNSWCYNNDNSYCNAYGRLYDWNTANVACPTGWHLPTEQEWNNLENLAGGKTTAGNALKSMAGWNEDGNGTDDYGFTATPGGNRNPFSGEFNAVGITGSWWTATEDRLGGTTNSAKHRDMSYDDDYVAMYGFGMKSDGYSVRCVAD